MFDGVPGHVNHSDPQAASACMFGRMRVKSMCLMCGEVKKAAKAAQGHICLDCISVCVAVTLDRLAGAMQAEEERNAECKNQ